MSCTSRYDFDCDGDVDAQDLDHLRSCRSGPAVPQNNPTCANARLDADQDVDHDDFGLFQRCYGGEGNPPAPGCTS